MMRPPNQTISIALLCIFLASCSSTKTVTTPTPAVTAPPAQISAPSKPAVGHFEAALVFLQNGQPEQADAELHAYLKEVPDNRAAHSLIAQIETPLDKLFPSDNFTVELAKDESLSSIAKTYLADPLLFYALARYNGIALPGKVNAGQVIKIPKTASALAAQAAGDLGSKGAPQTPADAVVQKPKPDTHKIAEQEYRKGLMAFQRQDLDGAIAAWDKVLAIDPAFKDAELNRAQALRLKENLKKLKH